MKRPPENKEAPATGVNAEATLSTSVRQEQYNLALLLALSLSRKLRIVTEDEAHALLDGRTPEVTIRLGMPQVGWRLPDGRFMGWRAMRRELGHVAVIVPGNELPVPFLFWAFRPDDFVAQFGGMTDRQLARHWRGFSRDMWEHWAERNRGHRERQDQHIAEWLAERLMEARDA